MKVVGIDTGLKGAIVCIEELTVAENTALRVQIFDTPIINNGKGKNNYDELAMRDLLSGLSPDIVFLEKAQAMPGQGVVSMFSTGLGYGIWRGLITALKIPRQLVHPKTWQKEMFKGLAGDTKDVSYQVASSLFPESAKDLKGPRGGLKDGRCDALLLCEYGRRLLHNCSPIKGELK